jgi:hypothetical protein
MKLRIHDGTLRLRLTEPEVGQLLREGRVESGVEFAGGAKLAYSIEGARGAERITARFEEGSIRVAVPEAAMRAWGESDRTAIESAGGARPSVTIEKDFQCLHKDADETPGAYPNPLARSKR